MAEQIRRISLTLNVDTNKRSISYERDVETLEEATELLEEWISDIEGEEG